jgi:hypothetical protein
VHLYIVANDNEKLFHMRKYVNVNRSKKVCKKKLTVKSPCGSVLTAALDDDNQKIFVA